MKRNSLFRFTLIILGLLLLTHDVHAQIPRTLSYQGIVNSGGSPLGGMYVIRVALYDAATSGTIVYEETQQTIVDGGVFNLVIGSVSPIPQTIAFDRPYWLGVTIDGGEELLPRVQIAAAPYALNTARAELANGLAPGAHGVVTSINELSGAIRITGDSVTTVTQTNNEITIHAMPGKAGGGLQSLQSPDRTIAIVNASGPAVSVGVADNAITTAKLTNGAVTPSKLAQAGATAGQILKWNGTAWIVADDNDHVYTAGSGISISGGVITSTSGGLTPGTQLNSTLRWSGTAWVENTNLTSDANGTTQANGAVTLGDGSGSDNIRMRPGAGAVSVDGFSTGIVKSNAFGVLSSGLVDLTTDVTNVLAVTHGGTGVNTLAPGQLLIGNGTNPVGTTALTAGAGISITPGAGTLTIANTAAVGWALQGNAATVPGTNFLGTTDNKAFEIHVYDGDAANRGSKRVQRFEPTGFSPNIIGGYQSNSVTSGVVGATIAGGGEFSAFPNLVTDDYGVVGGGSNNRSGNNSGSTADASYGTIAGGGGNIASGNYSSIGGGNGNLASAVGSSVPGGSSNQATGSYATVGGGAINTATGNGAVVAGGGYFSSTGIGYTGNSASGNASTVSGGIGNLSAGDYSAIAGGTKNSVAGARSAIAGGGWLRLSGAGSFGFHNGTSATDSAYVSTAGTAYFGNVNLWLANTNNTASQLRLYEAQSGGVTVPGASTNYSAFKAGSQAEDIVYTMPTTKPSANQVLTANSISGSGPYDVALTWATPGTSGSGAWNLTGNTSTNPATNFLGTSDNTELVIRVNNDSVMRYIPGPGGINLIGGWGRNAVTNGVIGAVIAGGGADGDENRVTDSYGSIGGGRENQAGDDAGTTDDKPYAYVGGGIGNSAVGFASVVSGGRINRDSSLVGVIGGGEANTTSSGSYNTIGGGFQNTVLGSFGTIGGGLLGTVNEYGTIAGGAHNKTGFVAFVGGGAYNQAMGVRSLVAGGEHNVTRDIYDAVVGGEGDSTSGGYTFIGGGQYNSIRNAQQSTIGGGQHNLITGVKSTIGGGQGDTISGQYGSILGGADNAISGDMGAIGGGAANKITGDYSAIPGGTRLKIGARSFGFNGHSNLTEPLADVSSLSQVAYFGDVNLLLGNVDNVARELRFYSPNSSFTLSGANYSAFKAGAQTASITYTLPTSIGTGNQVLAIASVSGNAATLGWVTAGTSNAWSLTGNSSTTSTTNFLGTTDNQAFEIHIYDGDAASKGSKRVVRYEPNATSANIIGGYSGNTVGSDVVGAVISGGGSSLLQNRVLDDYGTISGGFGNIVGDTSASSYKTTAGTIAGGTRNMTSNYYATVSGGEQNVASGIASFVGGGKRNTASDVTSVVAGGENNVAADFASTVSGGYRDSATGPESTVGGGEQNVASGGHSTVSGGAYNRAHGEEASVGGGEYNYASHYAAVMGGSHDTASGTASFVGGGGYTGSSGSAGNVASGVASVVAGGTSNHSFGDFGVIGGGKHNYLMSASSVIPGGSYFRLNGYGSFGFHNGTSSLDSAYVNSASTAYFGNVNMWLGNTTNTASQLRFYEAQSGGVNFPSSMTNYTAFQAGAQSVDITYILPGSGPAATGNLLLASSGSPSTMSWSSGLVWDNTNTRLGINQNAPVHMLHVVNGLTTDEFAAVYGLASASATTQAIGVWGRASNTASSNTGTIAVLATGNGNTTASYTNVALQVNDGEIAVGRTTESTTGATNVEAATAGTAYTAEGPSGMLEFTLGAAGNLATVAPTASTIQDLGSVTINNRYCQTGSIVLVNVAGMIDDGSAPNPRDAAFIANVESTSAGTFVVRLKMIPASTNASNYTTSDKVRIGYMIVNKSR